MLKQMLGVNHMIIEYKDIYEKVMPALQSKAEEFEHLGYEGITIDSVWNYCINKKWRKKIIEELKIHEIVETIFSISASEIVSFTQIKSFQTTDWFGEIRQDELNELLRIEPKKE